MRETERGTSGQHPGAPAGLTTIEVPTDPPPRAAGPGRGPVARPSRGLLTILAGTVLLLLVSAVAAPESLGSSSVRGMLPFAAVLAVLALGQTLVVQQGGIDLSVPGFVSVTVVVVTHLPDGDDGRLLPAVLVAYGICLLAGLLNGLVVARLGMSAIVTSLGTNALLYAVVLGISGGSPRNTTGALRRAVAGTTLGVPHSVLAAVALTAVVAVLVKRSVAGRRFEAVGDNPLAARLAGLRVHRHRTSAYVLAALLYCTAGVLLAGIVTTPSAFQGDSLLLPSVAAVVLGGTSLLGGKGSAVASAVAALFLSQLDQFVLTLGVSTAVQNIVQAVALAVGVAVYSVNWAGALARLPVGRGRGPLTPRTAGAP